ncbi:YIP1 family protein [Meiothermus sp.]|uniref:YIP1 family protein n=1 Tax=Meiothermus sp. TaxID=1955249 RepID=UPI0021DE6FD1|nr:YIP1 family protein [Meiothermus sp.]GIW24215.1 MAG: YIP1 family protein [Meiothermus sp.]
MNPTPSITDTVMNMVSQSIQVLTKPSVETFEQYENKGTLREAVIYVLVAAVITGLFSLSGGVGAFLNGIIGTIVGFLVFTYLVHYVGKSQGGTGTLDNVAYTFALFWAPINVLIAVVSLILIISIIGIFLVPLLVVAALVINVYFAYLAVQSSMNLRESGKIWITLAVAFVGTLLASMLIAAILR